MSTLERMEAPSSEVNDDFAHEFKELDRRMKTKKVTPVDTTARPEDFIETPTKEELEIGAVDPGMHIDMEPETLAKPSVWYNEAEEELLEFAFRTARQFAVANMPGKDEEVIAMLIGLKNKIKTLR